MTGPAERRGGILGALVGWSFRSLLQGGTGIVVRHPLLIILMLRVAELFARWWAARRRLVLGRMKVLGIADEIDSELIQGVLISSENLLNLGRMEKRTLFTRPLLEVLGGNEYLVQSLLEGAHKCRRCSHNCLVLRWLPPDERYHVLQACLNVVSSLFGPEYVHFNALEGELSVLFKSSWYCITVVTPTRPENRPDHIKRQPSVPIGSTDAVTFTDMSRMPRPTLRVAVVNEAEVRRIADGKLRPPNFGFFNQRHAERYRMVDDFARNFQKQLVRTPHDSNAMNHRSPFTSERAHKAHRHHHHHHQPESDGPDGGLMKRVQSQPNLAMAGLASRGSRGGGRESMGFATTRASSPADPEDVQRLRHEAAMSQDDAERVWGASEDNCFLRLHVPHFVGNLATQAGGSHAAATPQARRQSVTSLFATDLASAGLPPDAEAMCTGNQGRL